MIDCDLYESTAPVLPFIESLLQDGTMSTARSPGWSSRAVVSPRWATGKSPSIKAEPIGVRRRRKAAIGEPGDNELVIVGVQLGGYAGEDASAASRTTMAVDLT